MVDPDISRRKLKKPQPQQVRPSTIRCLQAACKCEMRGVIPVVGVVAHQYMISMIDAAVWQAVVHAGELSNIY